MSQRRFCVSNDTKLTDVLAVYDTRLCVLSVGSTLIDVAEITFDAAREEYRPFQLEQFQGNLNCDPAPIYNKSAKVRS